MAPGRYVGLSLKISQPNITIDAYGAEMDGAATEVPGASLTWSETGDDGRWNWTGLPTSLPPFPQKWLKRAAEKEAPTPELQAREDLYVCEGARERCVKYRRRPPTARLGRGEYATDQTGQRLLVCPHWADCTSANDWTDRLLLLTTTPRAITCTAEASGVTIRGLTVRRYAPSFHEAQVDARDCSGFRLEDASILESHAIGYWAGPDSLARDSHFDRNGQLGIESTADNVRFEDSTCNRNNVNVFPHWNAGGCKFFSPGKGKPGPGEPRNRVTWIGGEICGNRGNGFWTDGSAFDPIVRGALICDNARNGVHLELTYGGLIEGNSFRGNGLECSDDKALGSAVLINQTAGAVIRNNLIYVTTACGRGINFRHNKRGFWVPINNKVLDNTIIQVDRGDYGSNGFWILAQPDAVRDNIIDGNTYVVAQDDNHRRWRWQVHRQSYSSGVMTFEQWQKEGYDLNGRLLRVDDPAAYTKPADD